MKLKSFHYKKYNKNYIFVSYRDASTPTHVKKQVLSETFEGTSVASTTKTAKNRQNLLSICVSLIFIGSFAYAVFSFNNSLNENFKRNGKYDSIEFAHQKAMEKNVVVSNEEVMGSEMNQFLSLEFLDEYFPFFFLKVIFYIYWEKIFKFFREIDFISRIF